MGEAEKGKSRLLKGAAAVLIIFMVLGRLLSYQVMIVRQISSVPFVKACGELNMSSAAGQFRSIISICFEGIQRGESIEQGQPLVQTLGDP